MYQRKPTPDNETPGAGQRPGTGAGHPGRPGPHQRADRRPVAHQRPHRQLAPGPVRDKTGCRRRAGLTRLALSARLV